MHQTLETLFHPHGEEKKGNKTTVKLKQVQYISPIFRFEKQNFYEVFQTEISGKYIVLVLISRLFYFLSSLRRGDQSTVSCIVYFDFN